MSGKYFYDDNGTIGPVGSGLLYGLSDGIDPVPLLDFYAGKIHHTRLFAGRLTPSDTRTGQSIEAVYDRLPQILEWHNERNLRTEVTILTDTGAEPHYDVDQHVHVVSSIARDYGNTVIGLEMVNEWGHPTQASFSYDDLVDFKNIARNHYDGPIALGAAPIDELDPNTGNYPTAWTGSNAYSTVHLNRGKKPSYREAFRIKELHDIRNRHDCGGCNNEPGRFDDSALDGEDGLGHHRFAYLLGCLGMAFGFMSIAHSSFARDIYVPSGLELEYFDAYLRGASKIPRAQYEWQNANNTGSWPDSPIKNGAFEDGPSNSSSGALWRAYSYLGGSTGFVIASGKGPVDQFNLEYQNGYFPAGVIDEFAGVQIIQLGRN